MTKVKVLVHAEADDYAGVRHLYQRVKNNQCPIDDLGIRYMTFDSMMLHTFGL